MDRSAKRSSLRSDLTILGVVGVLLVGALATGANVLYREVYSASAFVERYLTMLSSGQAADALLLPGVEIDRRALLPTSPDVPLSNALLRQAALGELDDISILSEEADGDIRKVTAGYTAGGVPGRTTFTVTQDGWRGVAPQWRFAEPPLAAITLVVRGADVFEVNGFTIDRRQIAGIDSHPLDRIALAVFTPGVYDVSVDTPNSSSPGKSVLVDTTRTVTQVSLQTRPTDDFLALVQQEVARFLDDCAAQQVLQPAGCPFGFEVQNRLASLPRWSITQYPEVTLDPDGPHWSVPPTEALAHIDVDVRLILDGSIRPVSEDVVFWIVATVQVLADGTVSIRVGTP